MKGEEAGKVVGKLAPYTARPWDEDGAMGEGGIGVRLLKLYEILGPPNHWHFKQVVGVEVQESGLDKFLNDEDGADVQLR